jgi:hypothetical protein
MYSFSEGIYVFLHPSLKGNCYLTPATGQAEVGGTGFVAIPGKVSARPYLKSKLKVKGLRLPNVKS